MRRRDFITLLGGAAATWPMAARGQQPGMPEIGYLGATSADGSAPTLAAFQQGLAEAGFVEGRNLTFEYRWADDQFGRLPALAADLVRGRVALIWVTSTLAVLAAKAATTTIPIIFRTGNDPVAAGLVTSINRPTGNVTGVSTFAIALGPKRLELLRELMPKAAAVTLLMNPAGFAAEFNETESRIAARKLGMELTILTAGTENEIEQAFAIAGQQRTDAVVITANPVFLSHRKQIIAFAARHALPTVYPNRDYVIEGGMISYGNGNSEADRQAGLYAGRILKGEKPADLPVLFPTKFELVINLKTAKALGLEVPWFLQQRADEVIE